MASGPERRASPRENHCPHSAPIARQCDVKPVGEGVSELRIDYGPGIRLYFVRRGTQLIILLCGGDKATQARDIETAKTMAKQLKDENDGS